MNTETQLFLNLLDVEIAKERKTGRLDELQKIRAYLKTVKIECNFSFASLSMEQWRDVFNLPDEMASLWKNSINRESAVGEILSTMEFSIDFEKYFNIDLKSQIDKEISNLIDTVAQVRVYKNGTAKLTKLEALDARKAFDDFLNKNKSTFEQINDAFFNQQNLIDYIVSQSSNSRSNERTEK